MTAPRIVRGTKSRIVLYICGCIIIIGLIACYNNTLSQLEAARKSSEICHQQEENLSTQLQVITEYKQRLERSLKTEKAEHQQTKNTLETKIIEQKVNGEKSENELNLRITSLQQHFNLLQTQHDDFKEECSRKQNQQSNEINDLQAKLRETQEELKKVESAKETLKATNQQLQIDKENLEAQVKKLLNSANNAARINVKEQNLEDKHEQKDKNGPHQYNFMVELSSKEPQINKSLNNMPENHVIAFPKDQSSSTTKSTPLLSSAKVSQPSLNNARPLIVPTVTPKSANKSNKLDIPNFIPLPYKLPNGVVAPPDKPPRAKTDEEPAENKILNSRYLNKIDNQIVKNEEDYNKAGEVIDGQGGHAYDALGFDNFNNNDPIKHAEKQHFEKQHINNLVNPGGVERDNRAYDYKDNHNDNQMEENEDDDPDEYDDQLGRQKEPAVRN